MQPPLDCGLQGRMNSLNSAYMEPANGSPEWVESACSEHEGAKDSQFQVHSILAIATLHGNTLHPVFSEIGSMYSKKYTQSTEVLFP